MKESRSVQVAVTFDFDGMSPWLNMGQTSPSALSRGEFGAVGVDRILAELADHAVPATFFTPGHTALAYPERIEAILAAGHEIAHHGWVHEPLGALDEPDERAVIERGVDALTSTGAPRPVGFRAPGWDLSPRTVDLLVEYGFSYDSSMMARDTEPYWCRSGDMPNLDAPFEFGTPVDLVEIPVSWQLDDFPYLEFVPGVGNLSGLRSIDDVLDVWRRDFAYLSDEVGAGCMVVTMHPQATGRGHRIHLLREFLALVGDHPDAEMVRMQHLADRFRASSGPPA